jgi:hypothetical protein
VKTLDRNVLLSFVKIAGDRLEGNWVLMGGSLLPLLGVEHRVTLDIDIAGPLDAGNRQTLVLMEIAHELGLPVETINPAAAFFLREIEGWERELVPLHRGRSATIHRPNVTLFVLLKLARLTESDLGDCLEFMRFAGRTGEKPDAARILRAVESLTRKGVSEKKEKRLKILTNALEQTS